MKKISQIETGGRFLYGGVEWVKLYAGDGTVAISAEPVFERAFDEDNKNDWRSSSLRRELNGAFLDALVAEGADRAAFLLQRPHRPFLWRDELALRLHRQHRRSPALLSEIRNLGICPRRGRRREKR